MVGSGRFLHQSSEYGDPSDLVLLSVVWPHVDFIFSEIVMGIHVGNQNPRCYYNLQNRYLQIQDIWTRFQLMGHVRHIWVRSYESWKLREFLWPTKEGVFFAVCCFLQVVWEKTHKGPHAVACFSGSLVWKCSQFSLDNSTQLSFAQQ